MRHVPREPDKQAAPRGAGTVAALGAQWGLLPRGLLRRDRPGGAHPGGFPSPGVAPASDGWHGNQRVLRSWLGCPWAPGRVLVGPVGRGGHSTASSILETRLWETRAHLTAPGEEEEARTYSHVTPVPTSPQVTNTATEASVRI